MKILYLKLRNFGAIKAAMKRKEIEIDFSKSKHRIILFLGDNGSGKTAILSHLHPFSNTGNGDVRNGTDQIAKDKDGNLEDGYKEIHFQNNDDIYIVKHYYLYKSNKGMKSYINKNGTELNPNGNVSSFNEVIELEMSLTSNYLKLLRLGPNVKTFISMKAAERKEFTSELLDDIDIYSHYYKKINNDSRVLKSLMKNVADKMTKLKIDDIEQQKLRMRELTNMMKVFQGHRDAFTTKLGSIQGSINIIIPEGIQELENSIRDVKNDIKEGTKSIESIVSKLKKMNLIIIGDIDSNIQELQIKIQSIENEMNVNNGMNDFYLNHLNSLMEQNKTRNDSLKYVATDREYTQISDHLLDLHQKRKEGHKKFKGKTFNFTKDELLSGLSLLQEIDNFVSSIHAFSHKAVKQVSQCLIDGIDPSHLAAQEIQAIDRKMTSINATISKWEPTKNPNAKDFYVLFKPPTCECTCPYEKFYHDHKQTKEKGETINDLRMKLADLEIGRDFYLEYADIAKVIDFILVAIKSNAQLVKKLPEELFNIPMILKAINSGSSFYNEESIIGLVDYLEEYEEYKLLDEKIEKVGIDKQLMEKTDSNVSSLQNEIMRTNDEINSVQTKLSEFKENAKRDSHRLEILRQMLTNMTKAKELRTELTKLENSNNILRGTLEDYQNKKEAVSDYLIAKKENEMHLKEAEKDLANIEKDITSLKFRLMELENLINEKGILEETYDDIIVIKEALSSNKGIPLLFIQLYLKNTRLIINQLLETVYNGELELDEFDINEREFNLPYFKNGIWVNDVSKCSQGEETFVSIALSFALLKQSVEKYNIMLMDEIDGALDMDKRDRFLDILESQLDSINAEQVFMITHNNVFDNYPVDVIKTSAVNIDNYKNINVIFVA